MRPRKPAGASARPAARRRASARPRPRPRKKPAPRKAAPLAIKQPPPPRAADPFAKKTGRRRSYYTAEFLAEAKRRIEKTLQSTTAIARDIGMCHQALGRLVRRYGWVRPEGSSRVRGLSPALRLAMQADALVARAAPPPERGRACPGLDPGSDCEAVRVGVTPQASTPTPTLPLAGGGGPAVPAALASHQNAMLDTTTIDRFEAAVLKELSTVEAMRASLKAEPRRPADAERTARTLSVLTETLAKLRRLRLGSAPQTDHAHDDDYPADIDEFRREFARRINAFVASRTHPSGAAAAGPSDGSDPV